MKVSALGVWVIMEYWSTGLLGVPGYMDINKGPWIECKYAVC